MSSHLPLEGELRPLNPPTRETFRAPDHGNTPDRDRDEMRAIRRDSVPDETDWRDYRD